MFAMTLASILLTAGHYLLVGAGLTLLLFLILLAAVFAAALFIRIRGETCIKLTPSSLESRILVSLKIPFYGYDIIDFEETFDFDETLSFDNDDDEKTEEEDLKKDVYHVTITDEQIQFRTVTAKKYSSEYEIVIHTKENAQEEAGFVDMAKKTEPVSDFQTGTEDVLHVSADEIENVDRIEGTSRIKESDVSEFEYETADAGELKTTPIKEMESSDDKNSNKTDCDSDKMNYSSDKTDDGSNKDDSGSDKDDDDDENISENLLSFWEFINRKVDLSNPARFVSDSLSAASKIAHVFARFTGDLLLRAKIQKLSADLIYGLSDPAGTALSYGSIHSFKASLYAYFRHVKAASRSSKKRRRAGELEAALRDDILIIPDLSQKTIEGEIDFVFSYWVPRLYIPVLRLLLNKKSRQVIRHYIYPYYIRHSYKIWKKERKEAKEEKKKGSKKANSECPPPDSAAAGV